MRKMFSAALVITTGITLASPSPASGQGTHWIGLIGDWSDAANWSTGEPIQGHQAWIQNGGTAWITESGEVGNLTAGGSQGGVAVVDGGEFSGSMRIGEGGDGLLRQLSGTVASHQILLGTSSSGQGRYELIDGDLDVSDEQIGPGAGTFVQTGGEHAAWRLRIVGTSGRLAFSGGSLMARSLEVRATLEVIGGAGSILVDTDYWQWPSGTLECVIGPNGLTPIQVREEATLEGTLRIIDDDALDGTYIVIVANEIEEIFDAVVLPGPEWSWGVDETHVFVTKGVDPTPIEHESWANVKARFR